MLDNVGLRYPHRASGAKAPRTLRPLPLLRFAVSATGGAHLCSILYTVANSNAMNGWSSADRLKVITPWWKTALYALDTVLAVLTLSLIHI